MPVATKKSVKCPTCGAKTPADAERCRICTRALSHEAMPSQAAYEDALYGTPVRGAAPDGKKRRSLWPVIVVVVAGLLVWNYVELGYGPSWAHQASAHQPGGNWRTYTGVEGLTVFLPGEPIADAVDTGIGNLNRARVGVDDHWDAILDASILSSGAQREAEENLEATLAVGETVAPTDISTQAQALVAALVPGATLSEVALTERADAPAGTDYDLVAAYSNYPAKGSHGTVRARISVIDGTAYLAATWFPAAQSTDLHDHLLAGFTPDAVRAATANGG
jgi:hypothetical protein